MAQDEHEDAETYVAPAVDDITPITGLLGGGTLDEPPAPN